MDKKESKQNLQSAEKGLVFFIKMKLEHHISPDEIKKTLLGAGFSEDEIVIGFSEVKKVHKVLHQDLVAQNNFLPELDKSKSKTSSHRRPSVYTSNTQKKLGSSHSGLFRGRLRRKDFILGFLFFFGIGYVTLSFGALAMSAIFPETWKVIYDSIKADQSGFLITSIPFILAPITVMMLSMITRRLHNLDLPGNFSWLFLALFLPTSFLEKYPPLLALYIAILILFILMITKKGHPEPNHHGPHPESAGSFFRRIFNI
jgi:uncharacterized membrane protein YhaH (DUF805 family)